MPRPMSTASCTSDRWPSSSTRREDLAEEAAEPGRVILNHEVTDIGAAARRVEATGAPCVAAIEYREDGGAWFATYGDPDGNLVQLIQLTPDYWAKQRTRQAGSPARPLARSGTEAARCASRPRISSGPDASTPTSSGSSRRRSGRAASATSAAARASSSTSRRGRSSGEFTQMGFYVADIESTVAELRERGVQFEEVDRPGMQTIGGIADIEGHYPSTGAVGERAAWFHDSEGNLLGVAQLVMAA